MRRNAQGQIGQRAKVAVAVVEPDAVGRLEIVADVDVGRAVAVEVAKNHGETHVPRFGFERRAVFTKERPARPGHRGEHALAVVQVEHVRFTEFDQAALDDFELARPAAGDGVLAVDLADRDISAAAKNRNFAVVGDVEIQVTVAVHVRKSRRVRAGLGEQACRRGDVGEPSAAQIQKKRIRPAERHREQVQQAVAVHVSEHDAFGGLVGGLNAGQRGHVLEAPLAHVAEQAVGSL